METSKSHLVGEPILLLPPQAPQNARQNTPTASSFAFHRDSMVPANRRILPDEGATLARHGSHLACDCTHLGALPRQDSVPNQVIVSRPKSCVKEPGRSPPALPFASLVLAKHNRTVPSPGHRKSSDGRLLQKVTPPTEENPWSSVYSGSRPRHRKRVPPPGPKADLTSLTRIANRMSSLKVCRRRTSNRLMCQMHPRGRWINESRVTS